MNLAGLKGQVFMAPNGHVAIAVFPKSADAPALPGSIPVEFLGLHPAQGDMPAWGDILVGGRLCRVNPGICTPPFARLADCAMLAHHRRQEFPFLDEGRMTTVTFPPPPHPAAQTFVFARGIVAGHEVVYIDTLERVEQFDVSAHDGQNRIRPRRADR